MLAFGGTVADFTAAVEADCPLQRMMSFAFVEPDLGTPLEFGIQNPVDHEQGALDATDFPQGCRELVLPRIGGEFPQNLAWRDGPGSNGGGDAQDVGPIALDHGLVDLSADQRSQVRRGGRRIERVEPFGWQVADARSEPVAENGTCGKDVIGEAARVGELLADMASSIVHQQAIEDVRRFACRCRNHPGCERRILVGDVAIGFQARGIAIFRVDRFMASPCSVATKNCPSLEADVPMPQNRAMGNAACASTTMASARS